MYKLFSERQRNAKGELEVYQYEGFSSAFRNQVFYIIQDVVNKYHFTDGNIWEMLHDSFCREKGLKKLGLYGDAKRNCEDYIEECSDEDLLDLIDFCFNIFDNVLRRNPPQYYGDINGLIDNAVKDLNYRFKQHNYGYEFISCQLIRIDNKLLHETVIKPTLQLLYEEGFEGAEEEFRKAFECKRKGDNKNAIIEAGKSFESIIKTICKRCKYEYNTNDTAKQLIKHLEENNFYPSYMQNHITNLRVILESGLPTVRNKNSGHGQGEEIKEISDELVEYALNLAATNIVFLVKIYIANKDDNR